MAESNGNFKADISEAAIADALRSVERAESGSEVPIEVEGGEATTGEVLTAEQERIRALEAMLEDSAARARETQERLKETHERLLRTAADFENWKRRAAREKEEITKFAAERLLKDLIPVVDNLERAVANAGPDSGSFGEGVKLVLKQFEGALSKHGVVSFSAVGQPFDPNLHEALMQADSTEYPAGVVVSELVRGYLLNDRLVRPAAVVVSKGPGPAAEPSAQTGGESGADIASTADEASAPSSTGDDAPTE